MTNEERSSDRPEERIFVLHDDEGGEVNCQLLDRLMVYGRPYVVLAPLDEEDSVMIFRVENGEDGEERFCPEEDDAVNEDVFDYFRAAWDDYEIGDAE